MSASHRPLSPPRPVRREGGFTLVELLVVIIIVGVLAAVAVPAFLNQRDKAAAGATKATMRNAHTLVITARENSQQTLRGLTGSNCSTTCSCRVAAPATLPKVSDATFPTSTCGIRWLQVAQVLANASGESLETTKRMLTDGWGYPMTFDENEADTGPSVNAPCGTSADYLYSAGPNHMLVPAPPSGGWDQPDDIRLTLTASGHC